MDFPAETNKSKLKKIENTKRISKLQKKLYKEFKEIKKETEEEKNNIEFIDDIILSKDEIKNKLELHKLRMLNTPNKKQIKIIRKTKPKNNYYSSEINFD